MLMSAKLAVTVRATVAKFVDDRVLPIISECFEKERFPRELVPEMAAMGLLARARFSGGNLAQPPDLQRRPHHDR